MSRTFMALAAVSLLVAIAAGINKVIAGGHPAFGAKVALIALVLAVIFGVMARFGQQQPAR